MFAGIGFIIGACFAIIFYLAGKYDERRQWNALIKKGILPRPPKR